MWYHSDVVVVFTDILMFRSHFESFPFTVCLYLRTATLILLVTPQLMDDVGSILWLDAIQNAVYVTFIWW